MELLYLGIGMGVISFVLLLLILRLVSRVQKINPILGLGGFYVFSYLLTGKLINAVPESWQVKQIENEFVIDGLLGSFLALDQPKLSVYELAFTTFQLCLIGYFIYVFSFKDSFRKIIQSPNKKRQGPRL